MNWLHTLGLQRRAPQKAAAPERARFQDAVRAALAVERADPAAARADLARAGLPPLQKAAVVDATASVRTQLLRYELNANSGRFLSRARDVPKHLDEKSYAIAHPFKWLVVPQDRAQLLAPVGDAAAQAMRAKLLRTIVTDDGPVDVVLVPLHWQEAQTLQEASPHLLIIDDGEMHQTASPRSVLFGADPQSVPRLVPGIEAYSVKMHLSDQTYARMGGHDGSRVLNKNDCLMANVFSDVTRQLARAIPRMEVQGEDTTVCATIGEGADKVEIGAILRALPKDVAVPGFALFSPTKERLPHVKDLPGPLRARVDSGEDRLLAADALSHLRAKNPGLSKEDAFVRLFGEPILDVVFGLFAQGATLELHPQNFLLRFDERTGDVQKVVVRDLHGINYSEAWRTEHGLPDICSGDALQARFPGITQGDVDAWFKRPNPQTGVPELRDRYKVPGIFGRNFDVYISVFFYQSLVALEEAGTMTRSEVDRAMIKMRDAVEAAADKHGFDLSQLDPGGAKSFSPTMKVPFAHGMQGRILFRRPTDPVARAEYIEQHEKPVLQ